MEPSKQPLTTFMTKEWLPAIGGYRPPLDPPHLYLDRPAAHHQSRHWRRPALQPHTRGTSTPCTRRWLPRATRQLLDPSRAHGASPGAEGRHALGQDSPQPGDCGRPAPAARDARSGIDSNTRRNDSSSTSKVMARAVVEARSRHGHASGASWLGVTWQGARPRGARA